MVGNREVADEPRRDGAAAGLDAAGLVDECDFAAAPREIMRRGRARGPAADNGDVKERVLIHQRLLQDCAVATCGGNGALARAGCGAAILLASAAETTNSSASPIKTSE
jgi:hypothetical protein